MSANSDRIQECLGLASGTASASGWQTGMIVMEYLAHGPTEEVREALASQVEGMEEVVKLLKEARWRLKREAARGRRRDRKEASQ